MSLKGAQLGSFSGSRIDPHSSEDQLKGSLKTGQMMDESDDDFKELCASFFQRVKKNGTKEVLGIKKTQKASNSTQITSKQKRTKAAATKSKTLQGPRERKTRSGSQAPRTKKQAAPKWQESEPASPENGEQSVLASPVLQDGAQSTQTGNPARNTSRASREENPGDWYYFEPGVKKLSEKGQVVHIFFCFFRPHSLCHNP